jgi:hypothetical protein
VEEEEEGYAHKRSRPKKEAKPSIQKDKRVSHVMQYNDEEEQWWYVDAAEEWKATGTSSFDTAVKIMREQAKKGD